MKSRLQLVMAVSVLCLVLLGEGSARAQTPPPVPPTPINGQEDSLQPEMVAARKADVQARIKALGPPDTQKKGQQEKQTALEQILRSLTTLEEAFQRRAGFLTQVEGLPQRLLDLEAERKGLEKRPPSRFPKVTEGLRDKHEALVQAAQVEIQELITQTVAGEVRLATIPKEFEQRAQARIQWEKDLAASRGEAARVEAPTLSRLKAELLDLRGQVQRAEVAALEAERDWFIERVPLQDALVNVAQARLRNIQADLDTIKLALGHAIKEEQASLRVTAATITARMRQALSPSKALVLGVSLETVEIRRVTAAYRQRLNELSAEVPVREKDNARVKQVVDRLAALVKKYEGGEALTRHLLILFDRLQYKRKGYSDAPAKRYQSELRTMTDKIFALDTRLFEFDDRAAGQVAEVTRLLEAATPEERDASVAEARRLLEEQKAALRDQQQTMTALVQSVTRILALDREYMRQLDGGYLFALNKIVWLRNAEPVGWVVGHAALAGVVTTGQRLVAFSQAGPGHLWGALSRHPSLWILAMLLFLGLPWGAWQIYRRLKLAVNSRLARHASMAESPGVVTTTLVAIRAAVWPTFVALLAWLAGRFFMPGPDQSDLTPALVGSLQIGALVLWIGLLGRNLLRPEGWAHHFWGLRPELRRFIARMVAVGWLAALLCLLPRYLLLAAPGEEATGSLALVRLLGLAFQVVILVLLAVAGRRDSPLMRVALAEIHQRESLLRRAWPGLHRTLLGGVAAVIALDIFGYSFAAGFLWSRALELLAVALVLRLVLVPLMRRSLRRLVNTLFGVGRAGWDPTREATAERYVTVACMIGHAFLALVAAGVILGLWGVPVSVLLTSPTGSVVLVRARTIGLTVLLTIGLIRASKAVTNYVLEPTPNRWGVTREPSRKLKTLAPLLQTFFAAGALFAAALVILEQLGVATGPILAGVGILGLAIGLASQSLIKDVINGLFILFEDSLSVGDVVRLRDTGGLVEKFTLRAVTLRDLSGNVHVIPNSSFDMVTNFTKEYSRYLLEVGVAYREDVDTVIKILQEIDEEMRRDPDFGKVMLEPLEILGVDRFEASAVIIRARLKTRPIEQWRVAREFQRRMKRVFDKRGIEIPFPHRTLYWGIPKKGTQSPISVAMGDQQQPDFAEEEAGEPEERVASGSARGEDPQ